MARDKRTSLFSRRVGDERRKSCVPATPERSRSGELREPLHRVGQAHGQAPDLQLRALRHHPGGGEVCRRELRLFLFLL